MLTKSFEGLVFGFRSRCLYFPTVCSFIIAIYGISSHDLNDTSPVPVLLYVPWFTSSPCYHISCVVEIVKVRCPTITLYYSACAELQQDLKLIDIHV